MALERWCQQQRAEKDRTDPWSEEVFDRIGNDRDHEYWPGGPPSYEAVAPDPPSSPDAAFFRGQVATALLGSCWPEDPADDGLLDRLREILERARRSGYHPAAVYQAGVEEFERSIPFGARLGGEVRVAPLYPILFPEAPPPDAVFYRPGWPRTLDEAAKRILRKVGPDADPEALPLHEVERTVIPVTFGLRAGNLPLLRDCAAETPEEAVAIILDEVKRRLRLGLS